MKPLVLLVLVICTVVSMNLKLVSKRNSGKSQKKILFTFESGLSAHAIKRFRWLLFVLHIYLLSSEKQTKQCLLTRCYRMNFITIMFC